MLFHDFSSPSSSKTHTSTVHDERDNIDTLLLKITNTIRTDVLELYNQRSNPMTVDSLLQHSPKLWLQNRPKLIVDVFVALCRENFNTDEGCSKVASAIEKIYCHWNKKLVLPQHFKENLVEYAATGSKFITNFNNLNNPSGSYSFLKRFLDSEASEPIEFPQGTVSGF